ncbi:hypothetical protein ACTJIJ_06665 [Niabella sp. 22666]|jgi:hypothetical protein|uniref:hypothetical protein n=1 Tax=Niabella sp. 22666 TaxID=3453954 RepID=UPI003F832708
MTFKKSLLAFLCSAMLFISNAQPTTLALGDIAFTGANTASSNVNGTGDNKDFSFVLLRAINQGTTIYFTDYGWMSTGAFQSTCSTNPALTDGVVKWVADKGYPYGTQVVIRCQVAPTANVGTATGEQAAINPLNGGPQYVTIASPGEVLFAYQGSLTSPSFVAALSMIPAGWTATTMNCNTGLQPTGSTRPAVFDNSNNYAIVLLPSGGTNVRLKASVILSTNAATARATLANPANWDFSTAQQVLPASPNVLPVTFDEVTANIKGASLAVNWQTTSETNCKSYTVEVSADGENWQRLGSVDSKAVNGSSSTPLYYSFTFDIKGIAFASIGVAFLFLAFPRRARYSALLCILAGIFVFTACTKSERTEVLTSGKLFVRIAQHDIDNTTSYSKTIQATRN